jgi:hypothetical protein
MAAEYPDQLRLTCDRRGHYLGTLVDQASGSPTYIDPDGQLQTSQHDGAIFDRPSPGATAWRMGSEGINRLVDAEKTKPAGQEAPQAQVQAGRSS